MKTLKYALLGVGVATLVAASVIAYLAATFDPRDYQPRLVQLVKEKTGRTLKIAGELKLSFWPDLRVRLGTVSLTERDSEEPFADAGNVRFTVAFLPLLSRKLVAHDVLVQDAHVRITRFPDGHLNIDDLFKSEGATHEFDIAAIKVERSALSYRDVAADTLYELSAIEVETGRVANIVETPLKLSVAARDGARRFEVAGALQGRLTIDLPQRRFSLSDAKIRLAGRMGGLNALSGQLNGNFAAQLKTGELTASNVTATMSAAISDERIKGGVQVLKLRTLHGETVAEGASASLSGTSAAGVSRVALASPMIVTRSDTIFAEATTLELRSNRSGYILDAILDSPAEANLAAGTLALTKLRVNVAARGGRLPRQGVSGDLAGNAVFDFTRESGHTSLGGKIGASRIKAELASSGFATPAYRFVVEVDRLDLDRYAAAATASPARGGNVDFSMLSSLPATGTLRIGTLTTGGLKARQVTLAVKP